MAPNAIDEFLGAKPASKWRNRLQWLIAALAVGALVVLVGRFVNGGEVTRYTSVAVRKGDLPTALVGQGRLQPGETRMVTAARAGTVLETLVGVGDLVSAGQVLARLDPAAVQAAAAEAEGLIATRDATLARATAAERTARETLARFNTVRDASGGRAPSDREMDMARETLRRASAAVETARIELEAARAAAADRQAEIAALDIRAPAEGVVMQAMARGGRAVTGDEPLFELAVGPARLRMEVMVETEAAQKLPVGAAGEVTLLSGPRRYAAKVVGVRPSRTADAAQAIVILDVANPDRSLKSGAAASARIGLGVRRDVLIVPEKALRFGRASDDQQVGGPTGDAVYVVGEQGAPRRAAVTVEGGDGGDLAVSSPALSVGDAVIVGLR